MDAWRWKNFTPLLRYRLHDADRLGELPSSGGNQVGCDRVSCDYNGWQEQEKLVRGPDEKVRCLEVTHKTGSRPQTPPVQTPAHAVAVLNGQIPAVPFTTPYKRRALGNEPSAVRIALESLQSGRMPFAHTRQLEQSRVEL